MDNNILCNSEEHKELIKHQIAKVHGRFEKFVEADFYPEHEKRHETEQYRDIRHKIVNENNAPCVVCGVTTKSLKDSLLVNDIKYNPCQAHQIELHHFHIEWALANAIDQSRFNSLLRPHLQHLHPDEKLYREDFTVEQIRNWVDHHPHNLIPLCDVHHRHKYWGIHHVTYPNWSPANLLQQEFINQILEQVDHSQKV